MPEVTGFEDLLPAVKGIIAKLLGTFDSVDLEINRIHKAHNLKPRSCQITGTLFPGPLYRTKKDILKTREMSPLDFDGASITLRSILTHTREVESPEAITHPAERSGHFLPM